METPTQPQSPSVRKPISRSRRFMRRYLPMILVVLTIALAITSAYFYKKSKVASPAQNQIEVQKVIKKVAKLTVLPTDEIPTLATVSDPAALKNQSFFADAKKGDKVLIYTNAKKAYLYDPEADKIINIAPLNTGDTGATTPTVTPTPTTKK